MLGRRGTFCRTSDFWTVLMVYKSNQGQRIQIVRESASLNCKYCCLIDVQLQGCVAQRISRLSLLRATDISSLECVYVTRCSVWVEVATLFRRSYQSEKMHVLTHTHTRAPSLSRGNYSRIRPGELEEELVFLFIDS